MRRVYVASAYSSDPVGNVRRACDAAHLVMDAGFAPLLPVLAHYINELRPRPYEDWLAVDLAWVVVADAVLRLPGKSPGADRETALAESRGIPVFRSLAELKAWGG